MLLTWIYSPTAETRSGLVSVLYSRASLFYELAWSTSVAILCEFDLSEILEPTVYRVVTAVICLEVITRSSLINTCKIRNKFGNKEHWQVLSQVLLQFIEIQILNL